MTIVKKICFNLLSIFIAFFFTFIILEITFQILPTCDSVGTLPVTDKNPVPRHKSNRDLTWSNEWNFDIVAHKHSNNYGFFSDHDYDEKLQSPLMAVIGDSFVAAMQVENKETFHGKLSEQAKTSNNRVYSFGTVGAPLSTYLAYAEYVKNEFRPDSMVFTIIANDYDESFYEYKKSTGFKYFDEDAISQRVSKLTHVEQSSSSYLLKKLARQSALLRYLYSNLLINHKVAALQRKLTSTEDTTVKESAIITPRRMYLSKLAIDEFLKQLPERSGLEKNKILFVLDGVRPEMYSTQTLAEVEDSFYGQTRNYFMNAARQEGYEYIDMHPLFLENYSKNKNKFEPNTDWHWNEVGHKLVAEAISSSKLFKDFKNMNMSK